MLMWQKMVNKNSPVVFVFRSDTDQITKQNNDVLLSVNSLRHHHKENLLTSLLAAIA